MNELSLFTGAGGGLLASDLLGITPVCAVEIEPYCRDVLMQRQSDGCLPLFPIWDDIKTFDGRPWSGIVDIVTGGFPCQDISLSGKGAGLAGERSGLWSEMLRIIREVGPSFIYVENVAALTFRGLDRVLSYLASLGFDARWGVLGGSFVGNVAEGKRIWIFAYPTDCAVLESLGLSKYHIPCTEESCRRKFTRAVSEMLSQDDYSMLKRDANAVARGMDRLKAIGNGQVPSVAAAAFRILSDGIISR